MGPKKILYQSVTSPFTRDRVLQTMCVRTNLSTPALIIKHSHFREGFQCPPVSPRISRSCWARRGCHRVVRDRSASLRRRPMPPAPTIRNESGLDVTDSGRLARSSHRASIAMSGDDIERRLSSRSHAHRHWQSLSIPGRIRRHHASHVGQQCSECTRLRAVGVGYLRFDRWARLHWSVA